MDSPKCVTEMVVVFLLKKARLVPVEKQLTRCNDSVPEDTTHTAVSLIIAKVNIQINGNDNVSIWIRHGMQLESDKCERNTHETDISATACPANNFLMGEISQVFWLLLEAGE